MQIAQYEAKDIFRRFDIPVPKGVIVSSLDKAELAVSKVGLPVAIKAQVLMAGRGKAGEIKFSNNFKETVEKAKELVCEKVREQRIRRVLLLLHLELINMYYEDL